MKGKFLLRPYWIILTVVIALFVVTPVMAQTGYTATVNTGRLNVRSGPTVAYGVLATITQGDVVTLVGRNDAATWAQIITAGGVNGWVNAFYLRLPVALVNLPITFTGGSTTGTATMTGAFVLNVRSGPSVGFGVVAQLARNEVVTLVGRNSNSTWAQIRTGAGVVGWVNAFYMTPSVSISSLPVTDGTITNPPPAPPPTGQRIHIVQPGETMFSISRLYGVNIYTIAQANGILNLNYIQAGQRLIIP